jgi:hypothetical protein
LQVSLSREVRKILKRFVIGIEFGMVAAAIQGNVDGEDQFSHRIVLPPLCTMLMRMCGVRAGSPVL